MFLQTFRGLKGLRLGFSSTGAKWNSKAGVLLDIWEEGGTHLVLVGGPAGPSPGDSGAVQSGSDTPESVRFCSLDITT